MSENATENVIEQSEYYQQAEPDIEFNEGEFAEEAGNTDVLSVSDVLVGGLWGSFWKKFKKPFKALYKKLTHSKAVAAAADAFYPGAGSAFQAGLQLLESAKGGDKKAAEQIREVAEKAKAGDDKYKGAHDLLKTLNEARNEAKEEVAVGASKTTVILANGKRKNFKTLAKAKAYVATHPGSRLAGSPASSRPAATRAQRPVTQQQVAQAMRRVPAQNRGLLVQQLQRAQMQGRYPMQTAGQPAYGTPAYYAWQQSQQGYPYGMEQGVPYGYGVPGYMQQPYSGMYADEGFYEQNDYYGGDPDEELAAAYSSDEEFPDESLQGENAIQYGG